MDIIELLNSYQGLVAESERYFDIYKDLHLNIGGGAINYDGMPHGNNITSKTENDAIKLADAYLNYMDRYNEQMKLMLEIERMINTLSDWRSRYIIHEHYIRFRPLTAIGNDTMLLKSESTVRRYHRQGIEELRRRYEKKSVVED